MLHLEVVVAVSCDLSVGRVDVDVVLEDVESLRREVVDSQSDSLIFLGLQHEESGVLGVGAGQVEVKGHT